ncbi:MAG: ABC transporter substrate-binding protein [Pseudomonadota bacterium]
MNNLKAVLTASTLLCGSAAVAEGVKLEVTHWWTSGGEAAAVGALADVFSEKSDNEWVDGAIAGGGSTARPVMISRITGGDPMHATQFNHGRQAEELVEAGLMLDLTDVADAEGWRDTINPVSLLDSCTYEGKVYCVPINIHSWQWMWLSNKAYADAGIDVPGSWDEFVASAPALEAAGKVPLVVGQQDWQARGAFTVLLVAVGGTDLWLDIYANKNADAVRGDAMTKVFEAADTARTLSENSNVGDWNLATAKIINGEAGAQIMGDWAQGEFAVAEKVAGVDYTCLPGLGMNEVIQTGGDAFYFPKHDDPAVTAAQKELASIMFSQEAQVAFNLKKGSLPVRGDIDLSTANDCMKKGLEILADGNILPSAEQEISSDTEQQMRDLFIEFFNNKDLSIADAQERMAQLIEQAE